VIATHGYHAEPLARYLKSRGRQQRHVTLRRGKPIPDQQPRVPDDHWWARKLVVRGLRLKDDRPVAGTEPAARLPTCSQTRRTCPARHLNPYRTDLKARRPQLSGPDLPQLARGGIQPLGSKPAACDEGRGGFRARQFLRAAAVERTGGREDPRPFRGESVLPIIRCLRALAAPARPTTVPGGLLLRYRGIEIA
jgi:hypothetical protein